MMKKNEEQQIFSRRERFGFFCGIAKKFHSPLLLLLFIMGSIWGATLLAPIIQKGLIDALGAHSVHGTVFFGVLTVATLAISRGGGILQSLTVSSLHVKVSAELKKHFFRHLLEIPLSLTEDSGTGYLGRQCNEFSVKSRGPKA